MAGNCTTKPELEPRRSWTGEVVRSSAHVSTRRAAAREEPADLLEAVTSDD